MLEMEQDGAAGREVERAVGEQNGTAGRRVAPAGVPDPKLTEGPKRRRFTAEYKLEMLRDADACSQSGQLGALLRREGLLEHGPREGVAAGQAPVERGGCR
jgi:hypothetical protein